VEPFRIPPALPAAAMKTYQIAAPRATHWRPATCAEVECDHYVHGWQTIVPADSAAAEYIRHDRSRRHIEERRDGGLAVFTFEPGQRGFAPAHDHQVPTGRPERFLVTGGDWRGNPAGIPPRVHTRPDDWVEDFQESLDEIRTTHERG
jgi:hypothetical protein